MVAPRAEVASDARTIRTIRKNAAHIEHYNFEPEPTDPLVGFRHVGWDPGVFADCGISYDLLTSGGWPTWDMAFVGLAWRLVGESQILVLPGWDPQHLPETFGAPALVQWRYEIDAEDEAMGGHGFRHWGFAKHHDVPSYKIEDWRSLAETLPLFSLSDASDVTGIFGVNQPRRREIQRQLSSDRKPNLSDLLDPGDIFIARHTPRQVDPRIGCVLVVGHDDVIERLQRATADLNAAVGQFRRNARNFRAMEDVQAAVRDVVVSPSWTS